MSQEFRTKAELENREYNYFLHFKISIKEKNVKKIETILQQAKNMLVRALGASDLRFKELWQDVEQVMLHDAVRNADGTYTPNKGGRAKEAEAARKFRLQDAFEILKLQCKRGKLYKSELVNVADKQELDVAELEKGLTPVFKGGVKYIDDTKYVVDYNKYKKISDNLKIIGKTDLYDFLGVTRSDTLKTIDKAREEVTRSHTLKKTSDATAVNQLLGIVPTVFKSLELKKAYDHYILLKDAVWDKIEKYHDHGFSTVPRETYMEWVREIMRVLKITDDAAEEELSAWMKKFKLSIEGIDQKASVEVEICPHCGEMFVMAVGMNVCPKCGKQLKSICWNCHAEIRGKDNACLHCGVTEKQKQDFQQITKKMSDLVSQKADLWQQRTQLSELTNLFPAYGTMPKNSLVAKTIQDYQNSLAKLETAKKLEIDAMRKKAEAEQEAAELKAKKKQREEAHKQDVKKSVNAFDLEMERALFDKSKIKNMTEMDIRQARSAYNKKSVEIEDVLKDVEASLSGVEKQQLTKLPQLRQFRAYLSEYKNAVEKRALAIKKAEKRRKGIVIFVSVAAAAVALATGAFFTFFFPLLLLPIKVDKTQEDSYAVVAIRKAEEAYFVLDEQLPDNLFQKGRKITAIAPNAFAEYTNLQGVELHKDVNFIGKNAFYECRELQSVTLYSLIPPTLETNAFPKNGCRFFVPATSYQTYLTDESWGEYAEYIFPDYHNETDQLCILFEEEGGTEVDDISSWTVGTTVPMQLPTPTRRGYDFIGWYTMDINGQAVPMQSGVTILTQSVKMHASWELSTYTITYNVNGGELQGQAVENYTMETEDATFPKAQKAGYSFGGWYNNADFEGEAIASTTRGEIGNIILHAKWIPYTYTVGYCDCITAEQIFYKGIETQETLPFGAPSAPTSGTYSKGYVFIGWSTSYQTDNGVMNGNVQDLISWTQIPAFTETERNALMKDAEHNPLIALYAVWQKTPDTWFSYERDGGDGLIITGLTDEWTDYGSQTGELMDKTRLYLPEMYGGSIVKGIAQNAFKDNHDLTVIQMPDGIEYIQSGAFEGCDALTQVTMGTGVTQIDAKAFKDCVRLAQVEGENVVDIGDNAFENTQWLKKSHNTGSWFLSLGKVIVKYDTFGNTNIKAEDFPAGATKIAKGVFKDFVGNNGSIIIPDTITAIEDEALQNSGFANVTLPAVCSYGNQVLSGLSLQTLSIGWNVNLSRLYAENETQTIGTLLVRENGATRYIGGQNLSVGTLDLSNRNLPQVRIEGFARIDTLLLYQNALTAVPVYNVGTIGTLNLTKNKYQQFAFTDQNAQNVRLLILNDNLLTSLDVTKIYANKLDLASNKISSISCTAKNEQLKMLYMPYASGTKLTSVAFLANTPNVTSLDIANHQVSQITNIASLTQLTELYLGGNSVLSNASELGRLNNTAFCEKLLRLNLGGVTGNVSVILDIVKKCKNLTWLQVYGIGASQSQLTTAINVNTHPNLKHLKASHNGFTKVPAQWNYIQSVVVDYYDNRQE